MQEKSLSVVVKLKAVGDVAIRDICDVKQAATEMVLK